MPAGSEPRKPKGSRGAERPSHDQALQLPLCGRPAPRGDRPRPPYTSAEPPLIFKTHMRLSQIEARAIRKLAEAEFGPNTRVLLFGSRTDDSARGGDIDLLVEVQYPVDHPARTAAALAAALSRRLSGRSVDVLIAAPNLRRLPIHDIATRDGVPL